MGVSLLVYLVGAEFWWGRSGKSEHMKEKTWGYCAGCGIGLTLAFHLAGQCASSGCRERKFDQTEALLEPSVAFAPSALLGVCTLALLVLRLLFGAILSNADGHLGAGLDSSAHSRVFWSDQRGGRFGRAVGPRGPHAGRRVWLGFTDHRGRRCAVRRVRLPGRRSG